MHNDLSELPEESQKIKQEANAHEPLTERTGKMGLVSLWIRKCNKFDMPYSFTKCGVK